MVGTDVFHAAILLWAAGIAHIFSGNVDFGLAANILVGSVPGVILGSNMSVKWPQGVLRTALGLVLIAAGVALLSQGRTPSSCPTRSASPASPSPALFAIQMLLRKEVEADPDEQAELQHEIELEIEGAANGANGGVERNEQIEAELAEAGRGEARARSALGGVSSLTSRKGSNVRLRLTICFGLAIALRGAERRLRRRQRRQAVLRGTGRRPRALTGAPPRSGSRSSSRR